MSNTIAVTDDDFEELALNTDKTVVLYFTASWCEPCDQFGSQIDNLSLAYPDIRFLGVDVDQNQLAATALVIAGIPSTRVLSKGKVLLDGDELGSTEADMALQLEAILDSDEQGIDLDVYRQEEKQRLFDLLLVHAQQDGNVPTVAGPIALDDEYTATVTWQEPEVDSDPVPQPTDDGADNQQPPTGDDDDVSILPAVPDGGDDTGADKDTGDDQDPEDGNDANCKDGICVIPPSEPNGP